MAADNKFAMITPLYYSIAQHSMHSNGTVRQRSWKLRKRHQGNKIKKTDYTIISDIEVIVHTLSLMIIYKWL